MGLDAPNGSISVAELDDFLQVFTHDLRNRLNAIGLEVADLADQVGDQADATRVQEKIRECASYLKMVRDSAFEEGQPLDLPTLTARLRRQRPR